MQPYTATDMLYVIKLEYGLDRASARAFVQSSMDAAPQTRRSLRGLVQSIVTFSF